MKSKFTVFGLAALCAALAIFATNPTTSAKGVSEEKGRSQQEAGPPALVAPSAAMLDRRGLNPSPTQFQFSCSYSAAMPGAGYQILPQPAPVSQRQQQLFDWFSPWAIARNPVLQNIRFPILVLAGERNARAGAFGIAVNPQWFAELDEDITIGIYAHELGHVSQAYGLIPVDQLAQRYGAEGQADYFAGTLLKASRQFSPAQMQKLLDWVTPSVGDQSHAPGRVRADLMRTGYNNTP